MLVRGIEYCDPAYLRRLQSFFGESDRVLVVFDNVDLLSAQFADNGLHPHAFHSHACAHRVHILVFGHDRDLGALARFTSNGADDDGAIVNFRHFGLKQVLYKFRRGPRNHYGRPLRRSLYARNDDPETLAYGERLQTGLLFARHPSLGLADIQNYVGPLDALHRRVNNFADPTDVLFVDRVPFGLTNFLKDDLL